MLSNFFKNYKQERAASSLVSYKTARILNANGYDDLVNTGFKKNVIVYRCVNLISRAVASVDLVLRKATPSALEVDEIIYSHRILNLLESPNAQQHKTSFVEAAISYLLISGNCYIMCLKDEQNKPKELHLLRPDRVRVIPGENSIPLGYEYIVKDKTQNFYVDPETGASEILHIKLFNPDNDWYGMSPIEVAMTSINQHNAIAKQNTAYLHNGGRPSGALMYKSNLDSQERGELREDLKQLYEGGRNAGKILLLEGDFEWKEMGLSPKDLDFTDGKEISAKEIALAFGVPGILIGSMSSATFSNYKEARYNFWEETILPILNLFVGEVSDWLQKIFGSSYMVSYDIDSIQALSNRREAEWQKINSASFLTDNEKREAFGYPAISRTDDEIGEEFE